MNRYPLVCKHCDHRWMSRSERGSTWCGRCNGSNYAPRSVRKEAMGGGEGGPTPAMRPYPVDCQCGNAWLSRSKTGRTQCRVCGERIRVPRGVITEAIVDLAGSADDDIPARLVRILPRAPGPRVPYSPSGPLTILQGMASGLLEARRNHHPSRVPHKTQPAKPSTVPSSPPTRRATAPGVLPFGTTALCTGRGVRLSLRMD